MRKKIGWVVLVGLVLPRAAHAQIAADSAHVLDEHLDDRPVVPAHERSDTGAFQRERPNKGRNGKSGLFRRGF